MSSRRQKQDYAPHIPPEKAPSCHMEGCVEPGAYKAPKSKDALHDYVWLCLDHVREHNKQWDYFAGMDSAEIEHFMKDAVTGHRPTWTREERLTNPYDKLQDALHEFMHGGPEKRKKQKPMPPVNAKLRKALHVFELDYPFNAEELKLRYRALVKQYHPDLHKGDKAAEEKFKHISAAHHILTEHMKRSLNE